MTVFRFTSGVILGLVLTVLAVRAAPDESLVTHVPGFDGTLPSSHYAGYIFHRCPNCHFDLRLVYLTKRILSSVFAGIWP